MRVGKVYFVSAPGRIKIGYTKTPETRLEKLRQKDFEKIEVIAIIDGSRKLEKYIHAKLAEFRLYGEWYEDNGKTRSIVTNILGHPPTLEDEKPQSVLNEHRYVRIAVSRCASLIATERQNGASTGDAISLVAIKTGLSHSRVWQLHYRPPNYVTAAEMSALEATRTALDEAKTLVGADVLESKS